MSEHNCKVEPKLKYIATILKQQESNRKELVNHLNNIYGEIATIKEHEHNVKNELHINNLHLQEHMKRTEIMEERFELEKSFNEEARKEIMVLIDVTNKAVTELKINIMTSIKVVAAVFGAIITIAEIIKIFF